ncbi:hypothetical protein BpHYR1_036426 [Brachionus plicatilis]|uniref:Neurotransmitter-gated ion-channel ligand-binding domain-containing protein n=1 Tax=Brachionus plicatilis TaxID=10195 RepID=A0A3M7QD23_BRAPC|nr:hypothetical protein BpHYR1_036426 [Brachionus plicatilis]
MKKIVINFLLVLVVCAHDELDQESNIDLILSKTPVSSSEDLSRLRKTLLNFYDRKSRPLKNSSQPIQVKIGISIAQINKLDEVYQPHRQKSKKKLKGSIFKIIKTFHPVYTTFDVLLPEVATTLNLLESNFLTMSEN